MGLFGSVFRNMIGNKKRSEAEINFEKQVIKDGPEHAGKRIAEFVNEKISSESLALQFVLEELDASRYGNEYAKKFAEKSGFSSNLYKGAMKRSRWEGDEDELEHVQLFFRKMLVMIKDTKLMVQVSIATVDEIMKIWSLGKYA